MSSSTTNAPLAKVNASASEVCARFYLDDKVRKLLQPGMAPREFIDLLLERKQYLDAMDFIAHALPAQDAIWWGCLCLQHVSGEKLEPWEKQAAKSAVQWLLEPSEANRVAAKRPADVLGPASPAGALAAATHQTGGSIGPPDGPVIPPTPYSTNRAVALSVKVGSTKGDPSRTPITQRSLVELGIGVAEGRFFLPER